jgi:hypothetical protein
MKKDNKQRLFEVMQRLDKTFKPMLNENYDLDLNSAERYYGTLVSWVLDNDDLKIINKMRNDFINKKEEMNNITQPYDKENAISKLWDDHMLATKEALLDNARNNKKI